MLFVSKQPINNLFETLQQTVKFFDNLLVSLIDGIVITDGSQHIVVVNDAFCAFFGWNRREVVETNLTNWLGLPGGDMLGRWAELVMRLYGEGFCHDVEFQAKTDQGIKYLSVDASLLKGEAQGRADSIISIWRDVTERKQNETRIIRKNALLASINEVFEKTPACETMEELGKMCLAVAEELSGSKLGFIGEFNQAGLFDIIAISNAGWDACKIPAGQVPLVVRNMPIRGIDRPAMREGISRIVNGVEAIGACPDHVGFPEGHPSITSFLGVPLKHLNKTIGMIGLGNREGGYTQTIREDVEVLAVAIVAAINRKHAEVAIKKLNEDLKQRAVQLETLNKELESFSYSVSHDLRAPLRAIDGFSNILFEDYQDRLDDEGKRLFGVVRENTKKMGQLIDDILSFSRMGRNEMAVLAIDMEHLVKEVYQELAASVPERKIVFTIVETHGHASLPPAYGDRSMIRQVMVNLISNALKFTRGRETTAIEVGTITGEMEKGGIGEAGKAGNSYYVKDNGAGFDMKYADKLFGVFQRLHSEAEFPGTGIGLAIVKRVITRHGGRVWAEGKVGEGAVVYFTLPGEWK